MNKNAKQKKVIAKMIKIIPQIFELPMDLELENYCLDNKNINRLLECYYNSDEAVGNESEKNFVFNFEVVAKYNLQVTVDFLERFVKPNAIAKPTNITIKQKGKELMDRPLYLL